MSSSILDDIKSMLNIETDDTSFDTEIKIHINSAIANLSQLGVGPASGFSIEDSAATWEQLLGTDLNLNAAKTYIFIKTKLVFDPPPQGYVITALEKVAEEHAWRLNVEREATQWVDPTAELPDPDLFDGRVIIDGGVG